VKSRNNIGTWQKYSQKPSSKVYPLTEDPIPLVKGSKPVFGPIYNLSKIEVKVLKEYINTNLWKGLIHPSMSPFGSPVKLFYSLRKQMTASNFASIIAL